VDLLREWKKTGCHTQYLLVGPRESICREAVHALESLHTEPAGGTVELHCLNKSKLNDDVDRHLAEQMTTFHFALAAKPDLLWVEHNHPVDRPDEAYDCEFCEPSAVKVHPLFAGYSEWFDHFLSDLSDHVLTV
jgi:hypothetical protein